MHDEIDRLFEYAAAHSGPEPDYLYRLERETHLKTLAPQMLSGRLQGRTLALLSKLLRPQRILEVGTFTGYSALCLAEGLAPGGELHTLEGNPEVAYLAEKYFREAGFSDRIHLHRGDALALIPTLPGTFDLVFLDANKQEYPAYFDLVIDRLNPGGLLIADNVLWSGKVLDPAGDPDATVLHQFNERLLNEPRLEMTLLPLRDGLLVGRVV
jgi:predicted O-methyltransferase YrrM